MLKNSSLRNAQYNRTLSILMLTTESPMLQHMLFAFNTL